MVTCIPLQCKIFLPGENWRGRDYMGTLCTTCSVFLEICNCSLKNLRTERKYQDCSGNSKSLCVARAQPAGVQGGRRHSWKEESGQNEEDLKCTSKGRVLCSVGGKGLFRDGAQVIRSVVRKGKARAVWRLELEGAG